MDLFFAYLYLLFCLLVGVYVVVSVWLSFYISVDRWFAGFVAHFWCFPRFRVSVLWGGSDGIRRAAFVFLFSLGSFSSPNVYLVFEVFYLHMGLNAVRKV